MSMYELVRKARSIRRYNSSRPVSKSQLMELVDCARVAPCGGNMQKLRYRIVFEKSECDRIFQHIKWAAALKDWDGPEEGERPTGYIAILSPADSGTDVGIAGAVIQLAAADMGLGTCMLGAIGREAIASELKLPDHLGIRLLVAVGIPAETVVLEEAEPGGNLAYYRTPDSVHHVPKLGLADVLI